MMNPTLPGRAAIVLITCLAASAPLGAQLRPETGTLVVVNKGANTASVIDITSGETVTTLPTGRGPHEAAVSSEGRWIVITDYSGGNSLTIIDLAQPAVVQTAAEPASSMWLHNSRPSRSRETVGRFGWEVTNGDR